MYPGRFGLSEAAHLLRRAAARGRRAEAEALAEAGLGPAVARLLADPAPIPPPRFQPKSRLVPLVLAWLRGWLATETPAAERLALFWHGHFTSELRKVKRPELMWRQNATFREKGMGRFGDLLRAIARDPAMLLYLDNARSKMPHPNENWARELMELFTLGEGHYTEADVKASARAFAGWSITPPKKGPVRFVFRKRWADPGEKVFLGRRIRGGEEVLAILSEHPQTYRFLARKLLAFYFHPEPEAAMVEEGARVLKDAGTREFLAWLFTHPAFYHPRARFALVKSPVEYLVGLYYASGQTPDRRAVRWLARAGQVPFQPPNVKGWSGGLAWLDAGPLLARINLVRPFAAARLDLSVFAEGAGPEALLHPRAQLL